MVCRLHLHVSPVRGLNSFEWTVLDALGRVCDTGIGQGSVDLETSGWPLGAVVLQLVAEDGRQESRRLIVE